MKSENKDKPLKTVLLILTIAGAVLLPGSAFAQWPCPFWDWGPGWIGGLWGFFGGIFRLAFWILILVGVILLIQRLDKTSKQDRQLTYTVPESPLEILQKRYARGEISKEEYESIKRDLYSP